MIEQLILVLTTLMVFLWLRSSRNNRLPPGPMRLPLLGSMIQLYRANPIFPHLALSKLAEKYGDVMSFGFGMHTAVVVSSFEVMQDVFKRFETNSHRFPFPYVVDRNYGKNLGIIWSYEQKWIDVRRFTKKILKEFGYGKVKIMDESLNDSANQLVDYIKTEILDTPDNIFFVDANKFSVHVLNIVWNLTGGYKFDPNDKDLLRNMNLVNKVDQVFGHSNLYNMFPFLKTWFPKLVNYAEHLKIHNEIHQFTEGTVLFYNLEVMYNDKLFWKDPESFRPERFITESGEIDKMRSERILNTVFGVGPRVCFGETVAIDSMFMFLATMIINFKFDKVPGKELPTDAPQNALVIAPQHFSVKITTPSISI